MPLARCAVALRRMNRYHSSPPLVHTRMHTPHAICLKKHLASAPEYAAIVGQGVKKAGTGGGEGGVGVLRLPNSD